MSNILKMIAMDLDGTLLDEEKNISQKDREAVREAIDRGYLVTLATGRMYRSALSYAQELGIKLPLVTYNGALVKDPSTGKTLAHWPLALETAKCIVGELLDQDIYVQAYVNDTLLVPADCAKAQYYAKFSRVPFEVAGAGLRQLAEAPHKLLVIDDDPEPIRRHLVTVYGNAIKIVSSSKGFLEITDPETNKWRALQFLMKRFEVTREEILTVGDSDNDYEMVAHAGVGVAMGNAKETIQKAARIITASNTQSGVSLTLRSVMTNQVDVPE